MDPEISCIICTYRRNADLERALASLGAQTLAPERFEVLVVDNAESDETARLVETWRPRLHRLRYIREPRLGLSYARNRGTTEAAAPLVAFLDDDAVADPGWLTAMRNRLNDSQVRAVGGPADLEWPAGSPPAWLTPRYWRLLSYVDYGTYGRALRFPEWPYGLNMGFRKEALSRVGGFPVYLDRVGERLTSGGEAAVFWRMYEKGLTIWYEPDARVTHIVPAERTTPDFFVRRVGGQGASDAVFDVHIRRIPSLRRIAKRLRMRILLPGVALLARIRPSGSRWLAIRMLHAYWLGYLHGSPARRVRRSAVGTDTYDPVESV